MHLYWKIIIMNSNHNHFNNKTILSICASNTLAYAKWSTNQGHMVLVEKFFICSMLNNIELRIIVFC